MIPLRDYLIKNFEKSNLEKIADDYREKGYVVKTNSIVGPYRVDLAANKGEETIYIELKTHSERPEAKRRIKEMAEYFKDIPNTKFIVAVSRVPEFKEIVFDDIEQILCEFFMSEMPSDLDELSTHTQIIEVNGVSISRISIHDGSFNIVCSGMVEVTLQYGADADQEEGDIPMPMSFPFKFKGTIGCDMGSYFVEDCEELTFDTDAYYR